MALFCGYCGTKNDEGSKFCKRCGKQLVKPEESTPAQQSSIDETDFAQNQSCQTQATSPTDTSFCQADAAKDSQNYRNQTQVSPQQSDMGYSPNYKSQTNEESMQSEVSDEPKQKMSKGKKTKIVFFSIVGIIVALAIAVAVLFFTSPAYGVTQNMKSENYSEALLKYNRNVSGNALQELILSNTLNGYDNTVLERFKNGKITYNSAVEALEMLYAMGFEGEQEKIDELAALEEAATAFANATEYYENGDYENAIKEYSKIPETDANYAAAQEKLAELYPQYISQVLNTAKNYQANEEYEGAISYINTAYEILPDSVNTTELDTLKSEILPLYQSYVVDKATQYINSGDYKNAIAVVEAAVAIEDSEDFRSIQSSVETKYIESVTAEVETYLAAEDYTSAKRAVTNALTLLPDNPSLKSLQSEVETAVPTYLLDVCTPYSTNSYTAYVSGETFQSGGITYTNGFGLDYGNAVFNIQGQYTTLTYTTGHIDGGSKWDSTIKIYCDGVLVQELTMTAEDLPQRYAIDVTGVSQLKFEVSGPDWGFGNVTIS